MIKFYEVGQIEKLGIGDGTIKAAAGGTKNCFLGSITNGVVDVAKANADLKLFANYGNGDDMYKEFVTPAGELVTAWDIKAQEGKCLQVSPESITYASGKTYANVSTGDALAAGTDGNIAVTGTSVTKGIVFEVVKKINFGGEGLLVKIVDKGAAS